ncbi:hypothetical protein DBA29_27680 [Xenophilus aerolatus]|nr:hypothetical protein [Xenophilus aerolatus]
MLHPIFRAVLRRPDLLAVHLANYVELLKGEAVSLATSWAVRVAGGAVAVVSAVLALGLTGVAVMLGFLHGSFHWVLAAIPGAAWVLAASGVALAMRSTTKEKVDDVKEEVEADLSVLRKVKEPSSD